MTVITQQAMPKTKLYCGATSIMWGNNLPSKEEIRNTLPNNYE